MKKLEYKTAKKRSQFDAVSFEELDEAFPDHRINPQYDTEEIGRIISSFFRSEKKRYKMYLSADTFISIRCEAVESARKVCIDAADSYSSMYQDVLRGNKTEIVAINGVIVEKLVFMV